MSITIGIGPENMKILFCEFHKLPLCESFMAKAQMIW